LDSKNPGTDVSINRADDPYLTVWSAEP